MHGTYSHIDLDKAIKWRRWRSAKLLVDLIAEKLASLFSTFFVN